jgi:hypothetical protein
MRLSAEEKQKLINDILDDLPEGFSIFPPWLSLFFLEFFSLLVAGSVVAVVIKEAISLDPAFLMALYVVAIFPAVMIPNIMVMSGRMALGLRAIRISSGTIFVVSLLATGLAFFQDMPVFSSGLLACLLASVAYVVSHTVRFQAFALHRSRMASWSKDRLRKNREFKEDVAKRRNG